MQANWSLILNVLLLISIIIAISRLIKARKQNINPEKRQPDLGQAEHLGKPVTNYADDIISVRKVSREGLHEPGTDLKPNEACAVNSVPHSPQPQLIPTQEGQPAINPQSQPPAPSILMMFIVAKEKRQFAGYELLQTILAAGLRFGEGNIFHRHQMPNGGGPVVCSLATATALGVFDLQNIGTFSVRGLCLFMHPANNPGIDHERFLIMLEAARQLSEGMDANLLDDQRKPLTQHALERYYNLLNIEQYQDEDNAKEKSALA